VKEFTLFLKNIIVRKLILLFVLLGSVSTLFAQQQKMKAGAIRFPVIPPFTLLSIDSTTLTRENLAKHKKTLFMYFSPTCDHCLLQTDSLLANINKFKDIQIVMATYQPMEEMRQFFTDKKIASYKNIKMGRDVKFFFPPFYKMNNLPFLALYDEKANLITVFEGTTKIPLILEAFSRKKQL
jgi:hypothetical protein